MNARSLIPASVLLLAALGCRNDTQSPTDSVPTDPQADVMTATTLAFWQISAGSGSTCGVTADHRAYCWGANHLAQLGQGSDLGPEVCNNTYCSTRPVALVGGLNFKNVSSGGGFACGVTLGSRVYCWGLNLDGQLGIGTKKGPESCYFSSTACSTRPVAVLSGLSFRQVSAGGFSTCAVTTGNRVYCWGDNSSGQLGDGTTTDRLKPVAVLGGLSFRHVSVGAAHTCGITTVDQAYCWGDNRYGEVGDSTAPGRKLRPVRVAGGRTFRQLEAGGDHTCGVTTDNRAYCWGSGRLGQLGNGKTYLSFWPRPVTGGLYFRRVTAGTFFTCGETPNSRAYCWGNNNLSQLGNDDPYATPQLKPVAVVGGLYFNQVDTGGDYGCGKTAGAVVYCWGSNYYGQLGDGTVTLRARPTPVISPM